MHIAAFKMSGKMWYCVVFDGGTSSTYYRSQKEAEDELDKLKKAKALRIERERQDAEVYEEEFDIPLPAGFSIYWRVRNGVLYVLLRGPVGFLRGFTGPGARDRAKARAWRSLDPTPSSSTDLDLQGR